MASSAANASLAADKHIAKTSTQTFARRQQVAARTSAPIAQQKQATAHQVCVPEAQRELRFSASSVSLCTKIVRLSLSAYGAAALVTALGTLHSSCAPGGAHKIPYYDPRCKAPLVLDHVDATHPRSALLSSAYDEVHGVVALAL